MNTKRIPPLIATCMLMLAILACKLGGTPGSSTTPTPEAPATEPPVTMTPATGSSETTGACNNPYLPVVVGATWNYNLTGPVPGTFTRSILSMDTGGFNDQDVFGTGITRQGKWTCDNGALTALDPTGGSNTASVNSENIQADFQTTSASGVTLPAVLNPGDTWTQAVTLEGTELIHGIQVPAKNEFSNPCKVIGTESITVAAGTFNAVHIDCTTDMKITITMNNTPIVAPVHFTASSWYAEHVGLIKTTTTGGNLDSTIELVSYNIP